MFSIRKKVSMFITVKSLTGKEIPIFIESDAKIELVKNSVEQQEGIPPAQQRLIFDGKTMLDDKTVQDYSITDGSIIYLVLALQGGYIEPPLNASRRIYRTPFK